jgi:hypothetical protein
MAASDYYDLIQKFYIVFYQRPADPAGLLYWSGWLDQNSSDMNTVLNAFSSSEESKSLYGEITSENIGDVINSLYQTAFNRSAESEGIEFWSGEFNAGRHTAATIAYAVLSGAQGDDLSTVNNKLAAANSFTRAIDPELDGRPYLQSYAGDSAVVAARNYLANVTSDSSTVPVDSSVDAYFAANLPNPDSDTISKAAAKSSVNNSIGTLLTSDNQYVRSLVNDEGDIWTSDTITYHFNESIPSVYNNQGSEYSYGWSSLNSAERSAANGAVEQLDAIVAVSLVEGDSSSDIRFNVNYQSSSAGYAFSPGEGIGGDIFLNVGGRDNPGYYNPNMYGYSTVLHELGHAMGLKHSFEGNVVLPSGVEDTDHSVMSYTLTRYIVPNFTVADNRISVVFEQKAYSAEYMLYDVAALQSMYGAEMTTNVTDTNYELDLSKEQYHMIWDAGGTDTIDVSAATGASDIDMAPGTISTVNLNSYSDQVAATKAYLHENGAKNSDDWVDEVYATVADTLYTGENNLTITYGTIIENLSTGSADDTIKDNSVDNVIKSGAGDDVIYLGRGGNDVIDCGEGTDTVYVTGEIEQSTLADGGLVIIGAGYAATIYNHESILFV